MAVVKGMLSMNDEARAEIHRIRTIATDSRDESGTLLIRSLVWLPIQSIRPSSAKPCKQYTVTIVAKAAGGAAHLHEDEQRRKEEQGTPLNSLQKAIKVLSVRQQEQAERTWSHQRSRNSQGG